VYLAATAPDNIETLAHLADGGAYPAIRPDVVSATPVAIPGTEVLEVFHRTARSLMTRMAMNARESSSLAALRDALLPKLIGGELRASSVQ